MKTTMRVAALVGALLWVPAASGFGLKTHLWVAQSVYADVVDDCQVLLAGRPYAIPQGDCDALRQHPKAFFAGILGPDLYPDIWTGQTTAHPGIVGGWGNADFTTHLLDNAGDAQQRAYALGYLLHGAADTMAHTYVNHYAGDVFELRGERTVEARHILMERYIDERLPPFGLPEIEAPYPFLRDMLVHNAQSAPQHFSAGAAHTPAMHGVQLAVKDAIRSAEAVEQVYVELTAQYVQLHVEAMAKQATGEHALQAGELALQARSAELGVRIRALDDAQRAIADAKADYDENERLILQLSSQVDVQRGVASEAARVAGELQVLIHQLDAQRIGIDSQLVDLNAQLVNAVCESVESVCGSCFLNPGCWLSCKTGVEQACGNRQSVIDAINAVNDQLSAARAQLLNARSDLEQAAIREAQALNDAILLGQQKAQREGQRAALMAGMDAAKSAAEVQSALHGQEKQQYDKAAAEVARLSSELDRLRGDALDAKAIGDAAGRIVDDLNLLSVFLRNWQDGIDVAGTEFVKTGERIGKGMLAGESHFLREYHRWMSCHGAVYFATPYQAANLPCQLEPSFLKAKAEIDRIVAQVLPPPLNIIQAEIRRFEESFQREVGRAVDKATIELTRLATDQRTAGIIELFVMPDPVGSGEFDAAFYMDLDSSDERLVKFPSMQSVMDADLGVSGGQLQVPQFAALEASLTLSKLALLRGAAWESMISDLGGAQALAQFRAISPPVAQSILQTSLRSIDGNHQWQPHGLPYPRRLGAAEPADPGKRQYGHGLPGEARVGFWLFRDPTLRKFVFLRLFPEQVHGQISSMPEMQAPLMPFPICAANPFPSTSDSAGNAVAGDMTCALQ